MIAGELNRLVNLIKEQIKVAVPCEVVKYNHSRQVVEVKTQTGKIIPNIPIFQLTSNGNAGLFVPVAKGTQGALITFDDDLSAYLTGSSESYTKRKHDLSDSFFMAGFTSNANRLSFTEGKCGLVNKTDTTSMSIILHSNGKIEIKGTTQEMVAVLSSALNNIIGYAEQVNAMITGLASASIPTTPYPTLLNAVYPNYASNYTQMESKKTSISTDKTNLDTMKV